MATDETTPAATGTAPEESAAFGTVSRRVGTAFRYLLLASTLAGIVALAVLLLYVAWDAFQPHTADPGWYAVVGGAFLAPTAAVALYLAREAPEAGRFGAATLGALFLAGLGTGGLLIVFVDVLDPVSFLAYALALALAGVLVVAVQRRAHRLGFVPRLVLAGVGVAGSLVLVPGLVGAIPVLPSDGLILALTLGVPVGVGVARYLEPSAGGRTASGAGAAVALAAVVAAPLGVLAGVGGVPAVLVWLTIVVPVGAYAIRGSLERPDRRLGLALPAVILVGFLLAAVLVETLGVAGPQTWLDWQFLTSDHSNTATQAGIYPALVGTILLMVIVTVLAFPVGVGAAIYLEEYAPDTALTRIIDVNISNLAGVPSIVYGLLGLGAFVRFGGLSPGTVIVGGMTLALLILPIVVISAREAIRAVPGSTRAASYGMGATRWQTVRNVVLPRAFPGILTGTILALGRAIGETAPLLMIGAPAVFDVPTELGDRVGALPLQIYAWASTFANEAFYTTALAAGVVTLLVVMLTMNSVAIVLRNRFEADRH